MKLFTSSQLKKPLITLLSIMLCFSVAKAMAYSSVLDAKQLPDSTAKTTQVYLQSPKQTLWLGQASQWYLISLNPPNGKADIKLPSSDAFSFLAGNPVVVNSNDKIGWAYPINITPQKSGTLTLPEIQLNYPSQTLTSPAQQIVVKAPQLSNHMQLTQEINKSDIYLGQSIRLTTSWTFDYPVAAFKDVNLHIPSLLEKHFRVVKPWNKADENSKKSIGLPVNGQRQIAHWENLENNQVRIFFDTVIKPNRVGQYQIEPATLLTAVLNKNESSDNQTSKKKNNKGKKKFKGTQYLAYYNNQFFETLNDQEQVRRELSKSTALTLNVKALPANAPSNFSGIIGRPVIQASAQPKKVKKGEAIQYALTIVHPDIETLTIPPLTQYPSITQSFKLPAEPSISMSNTGSSVISHSIFPRRADIGAIPELTLNYFEPSSGLYRDVIIDNLPITVDENASFNFSDIEGSKNIVLKNAIIPDPEGIWALRWQKQSNTSAKGHTSLNQLFKQPWLWLMLLLLPPVVVTLFLIKPLRQRLYQQRLKHPVSQLHAALKKGGDPLLHLSKYCYLRFDLTPSKLNSSNVKSTLAKYLKDNASRDNNGEIKNNYRITELTTQLSCWLAQYQARYTQQEHEISTDEEKQLLTIIDKLEQCLPVYQQTDRNSASSSILFASINNMITTGVFLILLGGTSYSNVTSANELSAQSQAPNQAQNVTIESLHYAHQQALQLSIDSPHKGRIAHGKVAEQLASFIDDDTRNKASLFYDIGTSWFHAGRYGDSILWLRRAQNITNNNDVNDHTLVQTLSHNLAQARAKRLDQLPDNFSPPWQNQLQQVISSPPWIIMCWLGYAIFWLMAWRRTIGKDRNNKKLALGLVFVGVASISQVTNLTFKPQLSEAVITSQEVVSRKGPGLIFAPAFTAPLHEGAELVILKTDGQWSEVKLTNGEVCWLPSRVISLI